MAGWAGQPPLKARSVRSDGAKEQKPVDGFSAQGVITGIWKQFGVPENLGSANGQYAGNKRPRAGKIETEDAQKR